MIICSPSDDRRAGSVRRSNKSFVALLWPTDDINSPHLIHSCASAETGSVLRLCCQGASGPLARPSGRAPAGIATEPSLTVGLMHRQHINRTLHGNRIDSLENQASSIMFAV